MLGFLLNVNVAIYIKYGATKSYAARRGKINSTLILFLRSLCHIVASTSANDGERNVSRYTLTRNRRNYVQTIEQGGFGRENIFVRRRQSSSFEKLSYPYLNFPQMHKHPQPHNKSFAKRVTTEVVYGCNSVVTATRVNPDEDGVQVKS